MQAENNLHFAPRLRTIPLPPDEEDEGFALSPPKPKDASREILPTDTLFKVADDDTHYPQGLHRCLACIETQRPVVTAAEIVNAMLALQELIIPATNPPNDRMTVEFINGQIMTITPTEERAFVSVYDIKRAVVDLLEREEEGCGATTAGVRSVSWKAIHSIELWNGSAVQVHVWMWRGLSRRSTADIWMLYL